MTPWIGRLLIIGAAVIFSASSLSGLWVTTIRSFGGGGSLRVHAGATPWDGYFQPSLVLALVGLSTAALEATRRLRAGASVIRVERAAYCVAGVVAAGGMAVALLNGPGGSHTLGTGSLITRPGPLAFAGLLLAGSPLVIGLLLRPARRLTFLATSAALVAVVVVVVVVAVNPTSFRPAPVSGPVPDWRTTPEEPYPFIRPAPPLVATAVDGIYDRPPTETYPGQRPTCVRCAPFPQDAGRSTLTLDSGRYYLSQVQPRYLSGGHFVVAGTHLTLFNDPECGKVRGVYRWRLENGQLELTKLFDPCAFGQRARDLTDARWRVMPAVDEGRRRSLPTSAFPAELPGDPAEEGLVGPHAATRFEEAAKELLRARVLR